MRVLKNILIGCCILFKQTSSYANIDKPSYEFYGKHFIASYIGCDQGAIDDSKKLEQVLIAAAKESGAEILNVSCHFFESGGLTEVILLSESHASIHTYPEYQSCFVDLFTCGHTCDWKGFDAVLQEYLKPKKTNMQVIIRD